MTTQGARAMCGIAAAAVSVGVAQLVAAAFGPAADVRTAVGSTVIVLTPGPVKEWAIQTFGTSDKLVLTVLVLVVIAVIAAVTGIAETSPQTARQYRDRGGRCRRVCGGAVPRGRDGRRRGADGGGRRVRDGGAATAGRRGGSATPGPMPIAPTSPTAADDCRW